MDSEGAFEKVEQKSLNIQQIDDKKEWVFDANVVNGKSRIQVFKKWILRWKCAEKIIFLKPTDVKSWSSFDPSLVRSEVAEGSGNSKIDSFFSLRWLLPFFGRVTSRKISLKIALKRAATFMIGLCHVLSRRSKKEKKKVKEPESGATRKVLTRKVLIWKVLLWLPPLC